MTLALESVAIEFGANFALRPVSATLERGQLVGLIGPNGAGKSTLLRAMAALIHPSAGRVRLEGRELRTIDPAQRARQIAYLAQSTPVSWPISVGELVALGRLPHRGLTADENRRAVRHALERTTLIELENRKVTELSGGEYARAQLARALCVEAPILLADEPIAQLDPFHQLQIMDLLSSHARDGHLVVAVLHDLGLAARYCDRLLLLDSGRLVADDTPPSVLTRDRLRSIYQIDAIIEAHDNQPLIVPWRRLH